MSTLLEPAWSPARQIVELSEQLAAQIRREPCDNRRSEPRELVTVPVQVRILNELLDPTGDAIPAVTRDISVRGIGLIHFEPIDAEFVEIQLTLATGETVSSVVAITHSNCVGSFFLSGGQFLIENYPDEME